MDPSSGSSLQRGGEMFCHLVLYQFELMLSVSCLTSGRNEEWGTDLRKAFGPNSSWVAFDAFGDLLFFNSKKK